jgi:hypothetical protein
MSEFFTNLETMDSVFYVGYTLLIVLCVVLIANREKCKKEEK